jgi:5'-nucleotidase/UDP-sugar diphosphatase
MSMKWSTRLLATAALLALAFPVSARPRADANTYELILLHTNDHHGTVLSNNGRGGLAERATFIRSVRAANPQTLLVDAGDINTGSALSNMFAAEPDFLAYNAMGYEAAAFGNHEFDGALAKLAARLEEADFPFLGSNIKTADGGYLGNTPYLVKKYDGFTLGLFGITTLRTKIIASPDRSLVFVNEIDAAKEMVATLRNKEKVDIIIALTHIGDIKEAPDHVTSPELAAAVPGIDIIVDGHAHSFFEAPQKVGDTYIVTANEWGKYVGQGTLTVQQKKLAGFDWRPVEINNPDARTYEPDGTVAALLSPYVEKANASLKDVVGEAAADFVFGDRLTRKTETALGDMICDANVWYFREIYGQHIDFAFHNGGNMRAELKRGPITQEQILTVLPFENYLYIASLKGSDIIDLFNFIASIPQGAGGFPQVSSGVRYTVDYSGGDGILRDLSIGGAPVDPDRTYRFCTNDYLLRGGDGYEALTRSVEPFNTSLLLFYVTIEYIRAHNGVISPATDGRITVIGGVDR